jgi:hypothetical protein
MDTKPKSGIDYYVEDGFIVFTEKYHLQRGKCCGSKCRHCPYEPKHKKGAKTEKKDFSSSED